jgi:hypothetical protein
MEINLDTWSGALLVLMLAIAATLNESITGLPSQ